MHFNYDSHKKVLVMFEKMFLSEECNRFSNIEHFLLVYAFILYFIGWEKITRLLSTRAASTSSAVKD